MSSDQSPNQISTRKPFVKMQIEKVNLRTTETMGFTCRMAGISSNSSTSDCVSVPCLSHVGG
jgi:hypothetical protein